MRTTIVLFFCLTVVFSRALANDEDDDGYDENMMDSELQTGLKWVYILNKQKWWFFFLIGIFQLLWV